MSPVSAQIERVVKQLSDDDAAVVLTVARQLARRRRSAIPVETPDSEEAAEIRRRHADRTEKPVPYRSARAELGLG
ncbi:MAG: hypothetical protein FJ087_15530 [Deltaproteobacteria bacterium]|nr:hypothetical protein [Deltaproteobacteria bacterium]